MGTKVIGGILGANKGRRYQASSDPTRYDYSTASNIVNLSNGTISFWFKIFSGGNSDTYNSYSDIFSIYNPTIPAEFTIGLVRTGGGRTIRKYTVGTTMYEGMPQLFTTNFNDSANKDVWFHFCFAKGGISTLNGNVGNIVNNAWFSDVPTNSSNPTKYLKFGQTDYNSRYPGRVGNLGKNIGLTKPFILDTAITASDMNDIYNAGITFDPRKSKWADNLLSFWPLEDKGAVLNDVVGSNNLTGSTGGPLWANY